MLKRKIEKVFRDWKERHDHKPLIVKVARQIDKKKIHPEIWVKELYISLLFDIPTQTLS